MSAATSPDVALAAMARGQAAAPAAHDLMDQADAVLNRLVSLHRAARLSDRDAAVGIAVISELRSAADKSLRAITRGVAAGESLTTGASDR